MKYRSLLATMALLIAGVAPQGATAGKFADRIRELNGTTVRAANADMKLAAYSGVRHAIAVKDFERNVGAHNWEYVASNLSLMLESALMDTGRFVVLEREQLGVITREQDMARSGRMASSRKARAGMLQTAAFIATGQVLEIEDHQANTGGGVNIGGLSLGGRQRKAQITIIAKLVDTTTGQIVAKQRIVGRSGSTGLKVGISRGRLNGSVDTFEKTPIGEAVQDCVNRAARFFATETAEIPVTGSVVIAQKGKIVINRGTRHNVKAGMEIDLRSQGEDLVDPETGEVLDRTEGERLGRLRVVRVKEKVSYCDLVEGQKVTRGMTVVME